MVAILTRQDFESVQRGDFALAGVEGGEVGGSGFEGCGAHGSDQPKNLKLDRIYRID